MIIRPATTDDLFFIDEIYNLAILTRQSTADTIPYTHAEREAWYRGHDPNRYPVFVAEENGIVTGYGSLSPYRPRREALRYAAEVSYFVHPGHHRRGIGSILLSHAIETAPACNIKHLVAILGNNKRQYRPA
ncbi:MAG: N-acetyltransferase family protein [Bacteroidales bacterium]